ncbi:Uncharacterised protein [Mycobacteroides abscessus]|nr:Uncharacterised protein [Mycobacteroides abscessus]
MSPPLRITELTAHGSTVPVVASRAAMPRPGFVDPLVLVKEPATTTLAPSGEISIARPPYPPASSGAKPSSAPVDASSAAIRARAVLLTLENSPVM